MNITTTNSASFLIYVLLTMASLGSALVLKPTTTNGCSSGRQGVVGVWDTIHQNSNSRSNHNRLAANIPFVMDSSSATATSGSGPAILDRPSVVTRTERAAEHD